MSWRARAGREPHSAMAPEPEGAHRGEDDDMSQRTEWSVLERVAFIRDSRAAL